MNSDSEIGDYSDIHFYMKYAKLNIIPRYKYNMDNNCIIVYLAISYHVKVRGERSVDKGFIFYISEFFSIVR